MTNEDLKQKIEELFELLKGARELSFLQLAFSNVSKEDIALAVLELCLEGKLCANPEGISLLQEKPKEEVVVPKKQEELENPLNSMAGSTLQKVEDVEENLKAQNLIGLNGDKEYAPEEYLSEKEIEDLVEKVELSLKDPAYYRPRVEQLSKTKADLLDGQDRQMEQPGINTTDEALQNDFLLAGTPFIALGLKARAKNALTNVGAASIKDVVTIIDSMNSIPNVGIGSVKETQSALREHAVCLEMPIESNQLEALISISGSKDFVFDHLGVLCLTPKLPDSGNDSGLATEELEKYSLVELDLPEPPLRLLNNHGVFTVGQLVCLSREDLLSIPHMGVGKVGTIEYKLKLFCDRHGIQLPEKRETCIEPYDPDRFFSSYSSGVRHAVEEAASVCENRQYPIYYDSFCVLAASVAKEYLQNNPGSIVAAQNSIVSWVETSHALAEICESRLFQQCKEVENGGFPFSGIPVPPGDVWSNAAAHIMETHKRITLDGDCRILKVSPESLSEWVDTIDDRSRELLKLRLQGTTLQECGERIGVTRERVRQLCSKALESRPPLAEDRYRAFFDTYAANKEEFCSITKESEETYQYLSMTSGTYAADRKPLYEATSDESLPEDVRSRILEVTAYKNTIVVDGKRLALTKPEIISYLVKKYASDVPITIERLHDLYSAFLKENDIKDEGILSSGELRAFNSYVDRMDSVMNARIPESNKNGSAGIRYYDSNSKDFSSLMECLKAFSLLNVECTTSWLMKQPRMQDVCCDLDIINEYELHYVLNNWCPAIEGVELGRVPMITFGQGDRRNQILSLISELGPIDEAALANEYENRYGVKAATFRGSFLRGFDEYRKDGLYSFNVMRLEPNQELVLQGILQDVKDYCPATKISNKFEEVFPSWEGTLISSAVLNPLGFRISGGLIVRSDTDERSLFEQLIKSRDHFSFGDEGFEPEVVENDNFLAVLNIAQRAFEIIEVKKDTFWNISKFNKATYSLRSSDFRHYLEEFIESSEYGVPNTVFSLRRAGKIRYLDIAMNELGLDDYFIESVLSQGYVGGRIKRTSIGEISIFCRINGAFSTPVMIECLVRINGSMSVNNVLTLLKNSYGIDIIPAVLRAIIRRSDRLSLNGPMGIVSLSLDSQ